MVGEREYFDMAIGRFFKSLVNSEVMGEEIIKSIINLYEQTARYNPGDSSHDLLLKTYLARLKARRINIEDEKIFLNAVADVFIPAQLPEGKNIKALALYCLFKERPDIIDSYPKFAAEYERLISSLNDGSSLDGDNGDTSRHNSEPNSEIEEVEFSKIIFVCPQCNSKSKIPEGRLGVVTCPNCQSKSSIDRSGRILEHEVDSSIQSLQEKSSETAGKIDHNFYKEAAEKYANQKKINSLKVKLEDPIDRKDSTSKQSENLTESTLMWLQENAEYFEQKKQKGRPLSDYEIDIIKKYKATQDKGR